MGKKTKTPNAMDGIAMQQAEYNANKVNANQNTLANRPNQYNQFGSSTWQQDPGTGQWTQSTNLNQGQQDIFNSQQTNQSGIANTITDMLRQQDFTQANLTGDPMRMTSTANYGNAGAMPSVADYASLGAMPQIGQYSQQATDLYNQLAQPGLDRSRAADEAKMAAMGLSLGSGKAWDNEQFNLNDAENRSRMMAAQAGIGQGNTMFNQALAARGQGANELTNQYNQGMGIRQQGINEANNQWQQGMGLHQQNVSDILQQKAANMAQLSGLMGLGQSMGVPQFENFTAATPAPNLNFAAGANQTALNQANASNMDKSNNMGALGKVAGGLLSFL